MKIAIIAILVGTLGGCAAQLGPLLASVGQDPERAMEIEEAVLDSAVAPVPVYCAGPPVARWQFRNRVNNLPRMRGVAEIGIHCAGDAPLVLGD